MKFILKISPSIIFVNVIKHIEGKDFCNLAAKYLKRISNRPLRFVPGIRGRMILTTLLKDSITYRDLPIIDVAIITSIQEIDLLDLSIYALKESSLNPIENCYIVGPRSQQTMIMSRITSLVEYIADEDLLSEALIDFIENTFPVNRIGWIKQQALKFKIGMQTKNSGVLIVDADTILLKKRAWFDGTRQTIMPSLEFHMPYQKHLNTYLGLDSKEQLYQRISFVTHHQFFQRDIVRSFLTTNDANVEAGLLRWLRSINFADSDSPACEWHCYGSYLLLKNKNGADLIQWKNIAISREEVTSILGHFPGPRDLDQIKATFPQGYSISMHHYL